jgi:hypothetical protein
MTQLALIKCSYAVIELKSLEVGSACPELSVADLPVDMGAERVLVGGPWERYEDKDDV